MYAFGHDLYPILFLLAIIVAILWVLLPFAVFGIKGKLDRLIRVQEQLLKVQTQEKRNG